MNIKNSFGALKKKKIRKEMIFIGSFFILLPITIIGVFIVQRYLPKASELGCYPISISTKRESSIGIVSFETGCQIKAMISCSLVKDGEYYPCGQEEQVENRHEIRTDATKPLQPNEGYYVKINTGEFFESLTYIFPGNNIEDRGFTEENIYDYDSLIYGECQRDKAYDPRYDLNFDGCVNLSDMTELLPEPK